MIYLSLAGHRHNAKVCGTRPDGRLDLAVDAGYGEPVELSRIERVPADRLRPGTCAEGSHDGGESEA